MRRWAWLVPLVLLAAAAALMFWRLGPERVVDERPAERKTSWSMRWKPNTVYRYHLDYASSQDVKPFVGLGTSGDADVQSDVSYVGELHWRALEPAAPDGTWHLGMRLVACESAAVLVSGKDLLDETSSCAALLDPWELVVELDARGRPKLVREPEDAPEVFGYLAAYLAAELAVTWPDDGAKGWAVREVDMLGVADSVYRVVAEDAERLRVERARERYDELGAATLLKVPWEQSVRGLHELRLHRDGYLDENVGAQTVVATAGDTTFLNATARFRLKLLGLGADDSKAPALAGYVARTLKQPRGGEPGDDRALRDRAGDLTPEDALALLRRFAGSGQLPDHNRFLWQMTALLRLHPELAEKLIPIFTQGNTRARGLVLDLLGSAGTPETQAVMRTLLASDELQADPGRHLLAQRLGLVEAPDEQTVRFARTRFTDTASVARGDDHHSAAYTLGAVAGHADPTVRAQLRALLVDELTGSTDPTETVHAINALANAKEPEDATRFAAYAQAADGDVRLAAAAALGRPQTETGRATLLRMVADLDRGVQKQAIRSLRHYALTDADFEALTAVVERGTLHHTNVRPMLELSKLFRHEVPAGTRSLIDALIAAGIRDNKVLAAAHRLLRWEPTP